VIDILDREVKLELVVLGLPQYSVPRDTVLLEEGQHAIVEYLGRRDRRFAIIELGERRLGIGIEEGLLIDAPNPSCCRHRRCPGHG
jgi:hypothetical protein